MKYQELRDAVKAFDMGDKWDVFEITPTTLRSLLAELDAKTEALEKIARLGANEGAFNSMRPIFIAQDCLDALSQGEQT